jgi:formyltetrahydrofolate-dependent phosphoribosylglycinamide formyltransferase
MFQKLKQRWKVNTLHLILILTTFALGGSLCGYTGRKILSATGLEKGAIWIIIYIILVTILWPLAVLLVSIPLGQFGFFKRYIKKIFSRFGGKNKAAPTSTINVAIFASGAGSNAAKIIAATQLQHNWKVALIVCNKSGAGVLTIAANNNIPTLLLSKNDFFNGNAYVDELRNHSIDFIVLAGFLWKVSPTLIQAYPDKIVNIHPALLPKYGGKGMYGHFVHEAVINNKENQSGITIHYVDELYDHGKIIFQATCPVTSSDTADSLAQKIHVLEHTHYPRVINELLQKQNAS